MLEVPLAEKLIEQLTKYTDYNVNIMNEDGVIIASRNQERVGCFHEPAWQIINGGSDIIVVDSDNDYPGVSPGINMVIDIDGERIGVVGVTGIPEEIRPVALIIKMSIETMVKYERQKMQAYRRQTRKEQFLEMLTTRPDADPAVLRSLAHELNYRENLIRVPILCRVKNPEHRSVIQAALSQNPYCKKEDMVFLFGTEYILIFKTLESDRESYPSPDLLGRWHLFISDFLSDALKQSAQHNLHCCFYIGTLQNSLTQYYYAYQHCKWLQKQNFSEESEECVVWFYAHVGEYISQCIPRKELQQIFHIYGELLPESFIKNYQKLMGNLITSDFNFVTAAKQTYMHKNTFVYQYNKIRDILNLNPQNCPEDKWLAILLYIYLSK